MADWENCYYTFNGPYEAAQLRVFQDMHGKVKPRHHISPTAFQLISFESNRF